MPQASRYWPCLIWPGLAGHRADNLPGHLVLKRERVLSGLVVALRPDVLARLRVNELGCDANLIGVLADAAFQRIVDIEIAADLADVDRLAFVDEGRVARDHREIGKARQHGDDVFADAVTQIAESSCPALRSSNGSTAIDGTWAPTSGSVGERIRPYQPAAATPSTRTIAAATGLAQSRYRGLEALAPCRKGSAIELHPIDRDGLADVLDLLLPHRLEAECQLFLDLFRHLAGNADAAGVGKLLETRRDVDAFAMPVRALHDHFAEVDSDPNIDAMVLGLAGVPLRHSALDVDGALNRVDNAPEFRQQAVAHELEDAAMVGRYLRLDEFNAVILQALEGLRFVLLH